ncbi:expressed conserved protein [Echinococcus multilocularis]|uniref:Expressed conserved protein n=1 Tax=Echinococcus multilocularis TaxID=6211 RepID=A0A087VZ82_ECHMU|nr:expressed conserved protein [Echinococcus multilocularis]
MFDQSHSTALFLLEILLNHQGPIHISALYLSLQASLCNAHGYVNPYGVAIPVDNISLAEFIKFLQSFPSLFIIVGNYVYPTSQLDFENGSHILQQNLPYVDHACGCLIQSGSEVFPATPVIPAFVDPILRGNTMALLQNYLMTCGSHRYIPLQRLMGCLSYVSPIVRAALPNLKALTVFLRQYPEIFHVKDGMVGLTKPRRNFRQVLQSDTGVGNISAADDSTAEALKIEAVISSSTDFTDAKTITLPASDFSVILVLRRILRQAGENGLHVALVIKQIIEFPYNVQKLVGLTRFELHSFVAKYREFFDILPLLIDESPSNAQDKQVDLKTFCKIPKSFCLRINADALHMRSRILDHSSGRGGNGKDASRLKQHVGRVFRVAKSWGIIDLGNHVHVFFDKSIFRNVSDLQKVFQPNEMVHFDAIRAPLRSRAKWRATRVWKSDDNDILQHVVDPTSKMSSEQTLYNCGVGGVGSSGSGGGGAGSGESGFVSCRSYGLLCLPFLAPPSRCKSKSSVDSAPSLNISGSTTSATMKQRRCRSLDRLDAEIASQFNSDGEFPINEDYSGYYLSDEDDLNIEFDPAKATNVNDFLPFLSFDTLKRPIKLLHNTGGLLPDLEFPDSDISSWAPGDVDSLSVVNGHPDKTTCNASTQTWFTGVVTSAEFYHGPTCTHEQLQAVKE